MDDVLVIEMHGLRQSDHGTLLQQPLDTQTYKDPAAARLNPDAVGQSTVTKLLLDWQSRTATQLDRAESL
ncbi:MAG: hypothetical protein JXA21_09870 [Anaerolineae bacterium]|nr:hypothetical protein [Anaerolineae bacterium]